jgi:hypothetical protein
LDEAGHSSLEVPSLGRVLTATKTRLLILQVPHRCLEVAQEMGRDLVEEGVPATIVVAARDPAVANGYLANLYANIIHNRRIVDVACPKKGMPKREEELAVRLFYDRGSERILKFDDWLESLRHRFDRVAADFASRAAEDRATGPTRTDLLADAAPIAGLRLRDP